jgi:flavin reductase (DIM6/NTAB) family NADH-FMN oxidoreductase RutF/DNA-binding IclR family transcriptional regulator
MSETTTVPPLAQPGASPAACIDTSELRRVLGSFVTGVTVITTVDDEGKWWGLTANSFTSVSLNPPLVLWNQSISAPSYPVFRDAKRFAVSILAENQIDISRRFSGSTADKFAGVSVRIGLGGVPLIEGCSAYLECARESSFPGGDHAVFLGRVEQVEKCERSPLVFGQGRYLVAQPYEYHPLPIGNGPGTHSATQGLSQLQALRYATPMLVVLSRQVDRSVALSVWGSHGPTVVRWEQQADDPLKARLPAGQVCRLLTSATGLAWSAFGPSGLADSLIRSELKSPLGDAPRSRQELTALLEQIRARGIARVEASSNFTGRYGTRINAASAPVFDAAGSMVLAITVVGDACTTNVQWDSAMCVRLREVATQLSARLGFQDPSAA